MRLAFGFWGVFLMAATACSKGPPAYSAQQAQQPGGYAPAQEAEPAAPSRQAAGQAVPSAPPSALPEAPLALEVDDPSGELSAVARSALDKPWRRTASAVTLRNVGPAGLRALLAEAKKSGQLVAELDPLFDGVAGQRYARHSGLYWYTDLERAVAVARATRRTVLSQRMLGDLREDLSCANSRFFRVVLYPDPEVGALLRERFVLHWSSERPVPRVTVDYGDGRRLVRTITGNSIHYVLDQRGRVVDAIPGLMDAAAFRAVLLGGSEKAARLGTLDDEAFRVELARVHAADQDALLERWRGDLKLLGVETDDPEVGSPKAFPRSASAGVATSIAMGKAVVEAPLVPTFVPIDPATRTDDATWTQLGALPHHKVALSASSRRMMRELDPRILDAEGRPVALDRAAFAGVVAEFERTLAADSLKNQYALRRSLHQRFMLGRVEPLAELNRWVYADLFLTPASDPWLGLAAPGAFTALPEDGFVAARAP